MGEQWRIGDLVLGRWKVHKILRGGMGIVYVVYDSHFHQAFAAKTMRDDFLASTSKRQEFIQEAHAWVNLDAHHNVVRAHFVEMIHGRPFIFLEYLSGGDLHNRIHRRPPQLATVLRWGIEFCYGMEHVLGHGIEAHRDIKPSNCLLSEDNVLKIADFGLSRVRQADGSQGNKGGTWEYMAPEQWGSFKTVDQLADIYSFGVMLFEMATGELPFGTRNVGRSELERRHRETAPPLLDGDQSGLNRVIHTCLQKQQAGRYQSFAELRKELTELLLATSGEVPSAPQTGVHLQARELSDKGAGLNNLRRFEEAIVVLDQALRLDPQYSMAWNNKGYALRHTGRLGDAFVAFDAALSLGPHFNALLNKAELLHSLSRFRDALKYQDEAIAINPGSSLAWNNKGRTLFAIKDWAQAAACYKRALDLDPNNTLTLGNLGLYCQHHGRHSDAIHWFDRALAIDPVYADCLNGKAVSLYQCDRLHEAVAYFRKALDVDPCNAVLWDNLGRLLYEVGQFSEALSAFNEALRLDQSRKIARQLRASCRMRLSQVVQGESYE